MMDTTRSLLRKQSRLPLSLKVKHLLRARLESGEWSMGTRLPTLEELMKQYEVSRVTVRSALAELETEGLIELTRGKGTFVIGDVAKDHWLMLPTDWDSLIDHLTHLKSDFIELGSKKTSLPTEMTGEISLATYWCNTRVNYTKDLAYSFNTIYIIDEIAQRFLPSFKKEPALLVLDRLCKDLIHTTSQTLTVRVADAELARHLKMEIGMPVVRVIRIINDPTDRIIYAANIFYPAKYLSIQTNFSLSNK